MSLGDVYIMHAALGVSRSKGYTMRLSAAYYIRIAWGFFVARSNTSGNAKTSERGTSDWNTLHAFFVYIRI